MKYKLNLKNSKETVLVDEEVYEYLHSNPYLKKIKFLENLREHSLGYAFFQKHWPQPDKSYKVETIYIQKLIAEKFIKKPDIDERLFVCFLNGKPKDCRLKNLEWTTRGKLVRNTKNINSKTGYRGVTKDGNKYRAVIYNNNIKIGLGRFDTPEEAAYAYNLKAIELFGKKIRSINSIPKEKLAEVKKKFKNHSS